MTILTCGRLWLLSESRELVVTKHGFLVSHSLARYYVKACSGRCASQVVPIASLSYNHNGSGLLIERERERECDETWLSTHKRVAVNQLLINKLLSVVSRRENSWFTSGSHCCPPRSTDTAYWLVCAPLTAYYPIHRHIYIYRVYILFPSPTQTFNQQYVMSFQAWV